MKEYFGNNKSYSHKNNTHTFYIGAKSFNL